MRLFTTGLLLFFMTLLTAQTTHEVSATSNVFTPSSLTIQVGDIVNWTNDQGFHNANGSLADFPNNPEGFTSGAAAPAGWTFSHTFTLPGTYNYQCDPHAGLGMTGTIIVEEANAVTETVVITEINYNPPGEDSFEYIEFINTGAEIVDLTDWAITEGVEFTFPAATLAPGEFMIVSGNAAGFANVFPGYTGQLFEWTSGGINNSGEDIELTNAAGEVIDLVDYDDTAPWPTEADGDGATLVLCDFAGDNNSPFSWQAATTSTGVFFDGTEFFANPGAVSECGVQAPKLFFLTENLTRDEDAGTVTIEVIAQDFNTGFGPDFQVVFDAQSTVTEVADFSSEPALPISFMAEESTLDTFSFTVTIIDDSDAEMEENLVLRLVSQAATPDSLLFITIRDNDSEVMVSTIDEINDLDADGVAINIDQTVTLQGVVHCIDFRDGAGYQFWIIEPNGDGINVFGFSDVDDYVVTEGDELQVTGELDQFAGLLEIIPTQITVVSQGNDLVDPITVNTLSEEVESKLVTLEIIGLAGDGSIFNTGTSGANARIVTATSDTFEIRAEVETGIDSAFIAEFFAMGGGAYNVTGLVSQRDFDAPLDGFYQLFPCSTDDFSVGSNVTEPTWASDLAIYPNPTSGLLQINASVNLEVIRLIDLTGRELQRSNATGEQQRLNISTLPTGTYFLQLISGNEVVTRPIVKQ